MRRLEGLCVVMLVWVCTMAVSGAPSGDGVVMTIEGEPQNFRTVESLSGDQHEFYIKIDLLKITTDDVEALKSTVLKARLHEPTQFQFGFRSQGAEAIVVYTIEILPRMVRDQGEIELLVALLRDARRIKEETVLLKPRDSVIVELLKHRQDQARISVRIAPEPSLSGVDPGDVGNPRLADQIIRETFPGRRVVGEVVRVPVYAVDSAGNPVNRLSREDLALNVDGAPAQILDLTGGETSRKGFERVVFLVFDRSFTSWKGIKRAKALARQLVETGRPGDRFVVLTYSPGSRLQFQAGPAQSREEILRGIKSISQVQQGRQDDMFATRYTGLPASEGSPNSSFNLKGNSPTARMEYREEINRLEDAFNQLKSALATFTQPRIVVFFSEGVARQSFSKLARRGFENRKDDFKSYFQGFFESIGRAVNEGGGILFTVNSMGVEDLDDDGRSGEMSLSSMARSGGGRYFEGSDPAELVANIQKSVGAYYELLFVTDPSTSGDVSLDLRCRRKGVDVFTTKHSARQRAYWKMSPLQKKWFALDVARRGVWSRMSSTIETVRLDRRGDEIELPLPESFSGKPLDLYRIRLDPLNGAPSIDVSRVKSNRRLRFEIKSKPAGGPHIVVVDPKSGHCLVGDAN